MKRWMIAALSLAIYSGCAKPDYGSPGDTNPMGKAQGGACGNGLGYEIERSGLCAAVFWRVLPRDGEMAAFQLQFAQANNALLKEPSGELKVFLWMPSMGHGSSPVTLSKTESVGIYSVTDVYFVMPGAWEIRVQIKAGDGTISELHIPYNYSGQ